MLRATFGEEVTMNGMKFVSVAAVSLAVAACASSGGAQSDAGKRGREVKSRDGSFSGQVVGEPVPGAKFAELQIGMTPGEVQETMGRAPDRQHTYESGKRWIPFYYGNDARRMQVLYRGEGCLIFTDGNIWGSAGGDLIQIEHDPSGECYQP
jgi:hypothetical protein